MSDDEDAMEMVSFDHLICESVEGDKDSTGKHSNLENPSDRDEGITICHSVILLSAWQILWMY